MDDYQHSGRRVVCGPDGANALAAAFESLQRDATAPLPVDLA